MKKSKIENARSVLYRAAKAYCKSIEDDEPEQKSVRQLRNALKACKLEKAAMDFASIAANPNHRQYTKADLMKPGTNIHVPCSDLEFTVGGNTFWVHSPLGATVLRVKTGGPIQATACNEGNPVSHLDIIVKEELTFCLAKDANINE